MKKLVATIITMTFGLALGLGFGTQQASASHYQSVFPKFARGVWYQYVPKKGFDKVKLTKHYRSETFLGRGYDRIYLAHREFNTGKRISKPVWVKGGFFSATVARKGVGTIMQPWQAKYTHKYILGRRRQGLVDHVSSGRVAYDFRIKVPYQTRQAFF